MFERDLLVKFDVIGAKGYFVAQYPSHGYRFQGSLVRFPGPFGTSQTTTGTKNIPKHNPNEREQLEQIKIVQ